VLRCSTILFNWSGIPFKKTTTFRVIWCPQLYWNIPVIFSKYSRRPCIETKLHLDHLPCASLLACYLLETIFWHLNSCISSFLLYMWHLWSKHVAVLTMLFAVFIVSTSYIPWIASFPPINIFYDLNVAEQRVEIFMMFQSHGASLIHSEDSALKYIDLSLVKYLNIVNETEWNFITSPTCVHAFVRC